MADQQQRGPLMTERSMLPLHLPAGSPAGGEFAPSHGNGKGKGKGQSGHGSGHGSGHSSDGSMSYDPKSNHGTGYDTAGGDKGVADLQDALNRLGVKDGSGKALKKDGKLGPKTTSAVKEAQARLGLPQDGKVTPKLLQQLKAAKALPAKRGADMLDLSARATTGGSERRFYPAQFEVRAAPDGTGGTRYSLAGYATVYDRGYRMVDALGEYEERVRAGAGRKTLSENPDVVLLLNHAGMPLARTKNGSLRLSEDSTGLHSDAADLNGDRSVVREVISAVEERLLDEMSFAFRVPAGKSVWSDAYDERDITEYNLHRGDVSVVTFGANPNTSVALRAEDLDQLDDPAARAILERLQRRFPAEPAAIDPGRLALMRLQAAAQG